MSLLSFPLKTILMFHSTHSNPTIPLGYEICDGRTLTPGNFDITANSGSNYVVPDLRNLFPMGADRTLAAGVTGNTTDAASGAPGPKGTSGSMLHTLSISEMASHIHAATSDSQNSHNHGGSAASSTAGAHGHTPGSGGSFITSAGGFETHGTSSTSAEYHAVTVSGGTSIIGSHSHSVSSSAAGAHSHSITVTNIGSATPFDIRPSHYGLIFIMKVRR